MVSEQAHQEGLTAESAASLKRQQEYDERRREQDVLMRRKVAADELIAESLDSIAQSLRFIAAQYRG